MKYITAVLVNMLIISCQSVNVYYCDTSMIDDGEIRAFQLERFFISDKSINISISNYNSVELDRELAKIRKKITLGIPIELQCIENDCFYNDISWYNYAFVLNKTDTLYSHNLYEWRYQYKKTIIDDKDIVKLQKILKKAD